MTKLLLSAWNMNVLFKNNYVKLMVRLEKELRITEVNWIHHLGTMSVEMFAKRSEKFDMVAQEETTQCDRAHWDSFLGRIDEICT